jgi:hypothetical protein
MLENVLVAYSVWDQEVGYTQGMNFITLALLNVYSGTLRNKEFCIFFFKTFSVVGQF